MHLCKHNDRTWTVNDLKNELDIDLPRKNTPETGTDV
jgi:hypothetical protein